MKRLRRARRISFRAPPPAERGPPPVGDVDALRFLVEAAEEVGASLDFPATLDALARVVVPRLADWCMVEVLGERGAAPDRVVHGNPARVPQAKVLEDLGRAPGQTWVARVTEGGTPIFLPDMSQVMGLVGSDERRRLIGEFGLISVIVVPLQARGRAIGALALATAESGRRLDARALELVGRLAERAGVAVENARVHQEARLLAERLAIALEAGRMGDWEYELATGRVWWSPALEALHGLAPGTFGGTWTDYLSDIHPADRARVVAAVQASLARDEHQVEYRIVLPDGQVRWVEGRGRVFRDASGAPTRLAGVCLDVSERLAAQQLAEAERARASKLESVGVLAGGLAHDFNNLLTGMLGNLSLARRALPAGDITAARIEAAERAALRSRDLTRQLLTFAKGGAPIRRRASLAELVQEVASFALSGSNVKPVFDLARDVWPAEVDAGQVGQVIQNIVINAQQAMPSGGRVRIGLRNVRLAEGGEPALAPGPYVRLEIADEGVGIPAEHIERIFDPFFSTKEHGSGLGLATAYSIVRRHDGHIGVTSAPGAGTRFVLHLPAHPDSPVAAAAPSPESARAHRGRALVMDDEEIVLDTTRALLEALGFEVCAARDGDAAVDEVRRAQAAGTPFDVVLLDLTVRGGKGGRAAVGEIRAIQPDTRAIVSSGYSDDAVMADCRALGFVGVIAKPYTIGELKRVIGEALGSV